MRAGAALREKWLPVLAFPGVLALLLALEQVVLLPRAAERPPEASLPLWERHAEAHPDFAPSRVRLGQQLLEAGDLAAAGREFRTALELDPTSESAAIGANTVARALGGREAAIAQMERFYAANPGCRACAQNLAADHLALGHLDAAMRYIQPAIAVQTYVMPANYAMYDHRSDAFMLAGRIYEAKGRTAEAEEFYEIAIARYGANARAHFRLGALRLASDPVSAAESFERYRALAPDQPRGHVFLARARHAAGDAAAADAVLDAAERRFADVPERLARVRAERQRLATP